jgi:hypothetical protein
MDSASSNRGGGLSGEPSARHRPDRRRAMRGLFQSDEESAIASAQPPFAADSVSQRSSAEAAATDALMRIVGLQDIDGAWSGTSASVFTAVRADSEPAFAAAPAVAILRNRCAMRESARRLVERKALARLRGELGSAEALIARPIALLLDTRQTDTDIWFFETAEIKSPFGLEKGSQTAAGHGDDNATTRGFDHRPTEANSKSKSTQECAAGRISVLCSGEFPVWMPIRWKERVEINSGS